jgi:methionyl-tRNA formyltransferase
LKIIGHTDVRFSILTKSDRGTSVLKKLIENQLKPEFILSQDNDMSTIKLAELHDIPIYFENKTNEIELLNISKKHNLNLMILAGYSKILSEDFVRQVNFDLFNCHGGRLPDYRGASPIPWQIINGEKYGVCYILKITNIIDGGPILASKKYLISEIDDATSISRRVVELISDMYLEIVSRKKKNKRIRMRKQNAKNSIHWTKRYERDGQINWSRSDEEVLNLIRGLTSPYPGAFTFYKGKKIVINKAKINASTVKGVPGRYVGKNESGIIICTGQSSIIVEEITIGGKTFKSTELRINYGDDFESIIII